MYYIFCTLALLVVSCAGQYIPCDCGKGDKSSEFPILKYPWYAWIEVVDDERVYRGCLGTLISDDLVVFHPKCLENDLRTKKVKVRFGGNAIISAGEIEEVGDVIRYNNRNEHIALVKLDRAVNCKAQLKPVCLPDKRLKLNYTQNVTVDGLNSADYKWQWPVMLAVNATLLNKDECAIGSGLLSREVKGKICLKSMDYCMSGVFGGALTQEHNDTTYMIGIHATDLCGQCGKPTLHVKIQKYIDWIKSYMDSM